jgi:hypothetical protein
VNDHADRLYLKVGTVPATARAHRPGKIPGARVVLERRVTDDNGHTMVAYDLTAVRSFSVPGALLSRLLKRDSAAMIMQLRREIGRSICRADGRS